MNHESGILDSIVAPSWRHRSFSTASAMSGRSEGLASESAYQQIVLQNSVYGKTTQY
jgi:hypothetical protein